MTTNSKHIQPVRAELLAAKIEKLENFELPDLFDECADEPRLVRALWFLQFVSWPQNYPGGLTKFAADFIASNGDKLGTVHMAKHPSRELYDIAQAIEVLEDLPEDEQRELLGANIRLFREAFVPTDHFDSGDPKERRANRKEWTPQFLAEMSPVRVRELCSKAAREELAIYFKRLCEESHVSFFHHERRFCLDPSGRLEGAPWYFANVASALLDFIDSRRETLRARLAETEITQAVFRWMTKSLNTKRAVMISGNSRFGKTEAAKLYVDMYPGSSRLVKTPATGALGDLLREVAKSLGMEVGPQNMGRDLRERIDYVLRFSHLLLCFDESQLLLPAAFTRNTAPARLNWVRRSVMDQDVPAVFVCTPQSYLPAKKRFLKVTGFAMEQFDERILKTVHLPAELSESDLLAVARIHFTDLSDLYLQFVVDAALASERNYVSDIEKIATLAKDNAREHARNIPTLADIKAAISDAEVLPTRPPTASTVPFQPSIPVSRKSAAKPMHASRTPSATLQLNRRETRPLALQT
jgi:hypothetical protein